MIDNMFRAFDYACDKYYSVIYDREHCGYEQRVEGLLMNYTGDNIILLSDKGIYHIKYRDVNYIKDAKTDSEGKFTFGELKVGLYLILVDNKKTEDYEYSSKPILVSIPNRNEITDTYMYDLSIFVKTEAKSLNVNPGGDEDTPKPPYTGDDIYKYVLIFACSFVIFAGVVVYLIVKAKKEK